MAQDESDREDLIREATALIERVELVTAVTDAALAESGATGSASASVALNPQQSTLDTSIVAGFRTNGALSLFFGADPVYQFNPAGQLRRAFCDALLYKAERGRLVTLERLRSATEVQLFRRAVLADEQAVFMENMKRRLQSLGDMLRSSSYRIVGQAPPDGDVLGRLQNWLDEHDGIAIADAPNAN